MLEMDTRFFYPYGMRLCFVYDVTNRVADITPWLQEGDNEVCVTFAAGGEFDGLESALYIM